MLGVVSLGLPPCLLFSLEAVWESGTLVLESIKGECVALHEIYMKRCAKYLQHDKGETNPNSYEGMRSSFTVVLVDCFKLPSVTEDTWVFL